jgi:hypothetical protein
VSVCFEYETGLRCGIKISITDIQTPRFPNQSLLTNINETSNNSPRAPPGASEDMLTANCTSIIKNSTGTYQGAGWKVTYNTNDPTPVMSDATTTRNFVNEGNNTAGKIAFYSPPGSGPLENENFYYYQ